RSIKFHNLSCNSAMIVFKCLEFAQLDKLSFNGCKIPKNSEIVRLINNSMLTQLEFNYCSFYDKEILVELISTNTRLTKFSTCISNVGSYLDKVIQALKYNNTIQVINLRDNDTKNISLTFE